MIINFMLIKKHVFDETTINLFSIEHKPLCQRRLLITIDKFHKVTLKRYFDMVHPNQFNVNLCKVQA